MTTKERIEAEAKRRFIHESLNEQRGIFQIGATYEHRYLLDKIKERINIEILAAKLNCQDYPDDAWYDGAKCKAQKILEILKDLE